jgi:uncharacterized protein (DUF885 family)
VQLGLQQELAKLPRFRRLGGDLASSKAGACTPKRWVKTWASTPIPTTASATCTRACCAPPAVADTGVNAQGWSKQQAVAYLQKTVDMSSDDANAEVERIMAQPGQAPSNVAGLTTIVALRDKAKARQAQPSICAASMQNC